MKAVNPNKPPGSLGTLKLPLSGKKHYTVTGGPFPNCPRDMFGVKMAREIDFPHDVSIPTPDFSVPPAQAMEAGLLQAIQQITQGKPVYVGCMAGRGRTGLFLAVLSKCFGLTKPVEYVRENYYAHAVETSEQYSYVMNYRVPIAVQRLVKIAKLKSFFRFKHNLTN